MNCITRPSIFIEILGRIHSIKAAAQSVKFFWDVTTLVFILLQFFSEFLDEVLGCAHLNKSCLVVLSHVVVYCNEQGGFNF